MLSVAVAPVFSVAAHSSRASSPYAFQGLGEEGLSILAEVREAYGLKIVTEALDENGVDLVERYGDMIRIGARNMQNFSLLRRAGRSHLPSAIETRDGSYTRGMVACRRVHHG